MRPRQLVPLMVLCGTVAFAGWGAARLYENDAIEDRGATLGATPSSAVAGAPVEAPLASAMGSIGAVTSHHKLPEPTVAPAVMSVGEAATP